MGGVKCFCSIAILSLLLSVQRGAAETLPLVNDFSRAQLLEMWQFDEKPPSSGPQESLPEPFRFPDDVRDGAVFGVDVSHHNEDNCRCSIDWSKLVSKKLSFAYVKVSQGSIYFDPRFRATWKQLGQAKIARGGYHFLSSDDSPEAQAENFVRNLKAAGFDSARDLRPVLDVEWDYKIQNKKLIAGPDGKPLDFWTTVPPAEIARRISIWLSKVEASTGHVPIIYTNASWWAQVLKDEKLIENFKHAVWIADYSAKGRGTEKPRVPNGKNWALWQFSETGNLGSVGSDKEISADVNILSEPNLSLLKQAIR
jgi:lysozyme